MSGGDVGSGLCCSLLLLITVVRAICIRADREIQDEQAAAKQVHLETGEDGSQSMRSSSAASGIRRLPALVFSWL